MQGCEKERCLKEECGADQLVLSPSIAVRSELLFDLTLFVSFRLFVLIPLAYVQE